MANEDVLSNLKEILEIKKELEKIREKDIAYIWEQDKRLREISNLISQIKSELKEFNKEVFDELENHINDFLNKKNEIKDINYWFDKFKRYLEIFIVNIKMETEKTSGLDGVLQEEPKQGTDIHSFVVKGTVWLGKASSGQDINFYKPEGISLSDKEKLMGYLLDKF